MTIDYRTFGQLQRRSNSRTNPLRLATVTEVLPDPNQYKGRLFSTGGEVRFAGPVGTVLEVGQAVRIARDDIAGTFSNGGYVFIGLSAIHTRNSTIGGDPVETVEEVTSEILLSLPEYVELQAGGDPVEILIYGKNLSSVPTYGYSEIEDASAQIITSTLITLSVQATLSAGAGEYELVVAGQTFPRFFRVRAALLDTATSVWAWDGNNIVEIDLDDGSVLQTFAATGTGPGPLMRTAPGTIRGLSSSHVITITGGSAISTALAGATPSRSAGVGGSRIVYAVADGVTSTTPTVVACNLDGSGASSISVHDAGTPAAWNATARVRWDGAKLWGAFHRGTAVASLWWVDPSDLSHGQRYFGTRRMYAIDVDDTHIYAVGRPSTTTPTMWKILKSDWSVVDTVDISTAMLLPTTSSLVFAKIVGGYLYVAGRQRVGRINLATNAAEGRDLTAVPPHFTCGEIEADDVNVYVSNESASEVVVINQSTVDFSTGAGITILTCATSGGLVTPAIDV